MISKRQVPNLLTLFRVLAIPLIVVLLSSGQQQGRYLAVGFFILAAITDFVDGYLARRWQVISTFGALIDPLADKLLVMAALVMLVDLQDPLTRAPLLPGWMAVLVLAREIWITGLRGFATTIGVVISASASGKLKTVLQLIAIPLIALFDFEFEIGQWLFSLRLIGLELLLFSIIVSYWGAMDYTLVVYDCVGKAREGS